MGSHGVKNIYEPHELNKISVVQCRSGPKNLPNLPYQRKNLKYCLFSIKVKIKFIACSSAAGSISEEPNLSNDVYKRVSKQSKITNIFNKNMNP